MHKFLLLSQFLLRVEPTRHSCNKYMAEVNKLAKKRLIGGETFVLRLKIKQRFTVYNHLAKINGNVVSCDPE